MNWEPMARYRYAFKTGMSGTDVWALQINLQASGYVLVLDGDFGPTTERMVRACQQHLGQIVDGIAGLMTQRGMVLDLSRHADTTSNLPKGLLKSVASNESGFALAAYSAHPSDPNGFDIGPYQQAFPPMERSQQNYANAYNARWSADVTGKAIRERKTRFRAAPKVSTDQRAWQLAVLSHNWPLAAENLAFHGSIFLDPTQDTQSAAWVIAASGGRLRTPQQWAEHYIQAATAFCTPPWPA